jgi:hypothetical protein
MLSGEDVQRWALKQAGNLRKISYSLYDELRKEICVITCSRIELRNGREGSCHALGGETPGQNPEAGDFFFQNHVQLMLCIYRDRNKH